MERLPGGQVHDSWGEIEMLSILGGSAGRSARQLVHIREAASRVDDLFSAVSARGSMNDTGFGRLMIDLGLRRIDDAAAAARPGLKYSSRPLENRWAGDLSTMRSQLAVLDDAAAPMAAIKGARETGSFHAAAIVKDVDEALPELIRKARLTAAARATIAATALTGAGLIATHDA